MFAKTLILTALTAAVAFAQPPGGGPRSGQGRNFTEIKAYLNLSDTQVTSIQESNRTGIEAMRTNMQQAREKMKTLQTAVRESNDPTVVGNAVIEMRNMRKQAQEARAKITEQAVSFLSAEQKEKLKALETSKELRAEKRQAMALMLLEGPGMGMGRGPRGGRGGGMMRGPGRFGPGV
jgi:Spy/CpxP family protein refolding chaperone